MSKENWNLLNAEYKPAEKTYWEGRKSNPDIENQYWHQQIELLDANDLQQKTSGKPKIDVAILGYVCDEGVRRNSGRIGAKEGAKAIRERLAKLPIHFEYKKVVDIGDIVCVDDDMEACQDKFSILITDLISEFKYF